MSYTKFTPAPWSFVDHECYPSFGVIKGASFDISVVLQATDINFDQSFQRTADAHLIAAAPDLYEALIEAKHELEEFAAEYMAENYNSPPLNAALAKARGETQ